MKKVALLLVILYSALALSACKKKEEVPVETAPPIGYGVMVQETEAPALNSELDALKETEVQEDLDRIIKETEPEIELASKDADIFNSVAVLNFNKMAIPVIYDGTSGLLSGTNVSSTILNFEANGFKNKSISFTLSTQDDKEIVKEQHSFVTTTTNDKGEEVSDYANDAYRYVSEYFQIIDEYSTYKLGLKSAEIMIEYISPDATPLMYTCHIDLMSNFNYENIVYTYDAETTLTKFGSGAAKLMPEYFEDLGTKIEDNYREKRENKGYAEINIVKNIVTEDVTNQKTGEVTQVEHLVPVTLEYRVSYPIYTQNTIEDTALNYIYSGEEYSTDAAVVALFNRFAYINYSGNMFYAPNLLLDQYLGKVGDMDIVADKLREAGLEAYKMEYNTLNKHEIISLSDSNDMQSKCSALLGDIEGDTRYSLRVYYRNSLAPDFIIFYDIINNGKGLQSLTLTFKDISSRYTDKEAYSKEIQTVKITKDGVLPTNLQLNALKEVAVKDGYKYATSNTYRFCIKYDGSNVKEMSVKRFFKDTKPSDEEPTDDSQEDTEVSLESEAEESLEGETEPIDEVDTDTITDEIKDSTDDTVNTSDK